MPKYYNKTTNALIEKVHLTHLFDMFAGTSAGSIIVAALAAPDPDNAKQPRFWSSDIVDIFAENIDTIFMANPHAPGALA